MGTAAGDPCGGGTSMKQTSHLLFMLLPLNFSGMKSFSLREAAASRSVEI
ncbi:MAG TPA: hypothetical protein VM577_00965 [Anaerovoracaceae bacterium]|nr:hypothetical protein [Anaerovoracaceae bacterium]